MKTKQENEEMIAQIGVDLHYLEKLKEQTDGAFKTAVSHGMDALRFIVREIYGGNLNKTEESLNKTDDNYDPATDTMNDPLTRERYRNGKR